MPTSWKTPSYRHFSENLSRILNSSAPALVAISLRAIHRSSYLFENKTELELYEETNKILEFIATDYLGSKSDNLGMAVLYGGREVEASRNHYIDYLSKKRAEISGLISEVRYSHHIESSVAELLIKSLECGEKVIYLNILHLRYYPGASGIASAMTSVIPCIYNSALRVLEVAITLDPSVSFGIQRDINHIFNFIVSDIIPDRSIPLAPVRKDFFDFPTTFNFEYALQSDLSNELHLELASNLANNPEQIKQMSPRKFEELICGIFKNFGFSVKLTAQAHDGGRDIIAVDTFSVSKTKYLIECKHCKNIGIDFVRSLYGVVTDERATKGILVTTANSFSKNIKNHIYRNKWQLDIKVFNDIIKWLRDYESDQLKRFIP